MAIHFTKAKIESLPIPKQGRDLYQDDQAKGLGIQVSHTGKRTFYFYGRIAGHREWKVIADYPDFTIEQARLEIGSLRKKLATWRNDEFEGPHPLKQPSGLTLDSLLESYIIEHLNKTAITPAAAEKRLRWEYDKYIPANWKPLKLAMIRAEDVATLHTKIGEKTPIMANRVVEMLRRLYKFALKADKWRGKDPTAHVEMYPEQTRERFIEAQEAKRFFDALLDAQTPADLRDFVILALVTAQRKSDVLAMKWSEVHLERAVWEMTSPTKPSKGKRASRLRRIPLSDEAVGLLRRRAAQSAENPTDWVFPGPGATGHVIEPKRAWTTLRKRANVSDFTVHDLRRSLASYMAGRGESLITIARMLGHASTESTEVYARLDLESIRRANAGAVATVLGMASAKARRKLKSLTA